MQDPRNSAKHNQATIDHILEDMEKKLAKLKEDFDDKQLNIMKFLDEYIIQESIFQRQVEPLQGQLQIIKQVIQAGEGYPHMLLNKKGTPKIEGRLRGFYLYRDEIFDKIFVLIVHSANLHEILCVSELAKEEGKLPLLKKIIWPNNYDTLISLDTRLIELIKANCKHFFGKWLGLEIFDIENLKAQHHELCLQLRENFILGRREFFKSRAQYYDKDADKYILLNRQGLEVVMGHFIEGLDEDLFKHHEQFTVSLEKIKLLMDLDQYEKSLNIEINKLMSLYDKNLDAKMPYMEKYNDNEVSYSDNKQMFLYQTFLKIIEAGANIDECQAFIDQFKLDINFQEKEGFCLLHRISKPEIVNMLLQYPLINTDLKLSYKKPYDHRGFTPLHWHVLEGNLAIVQLLLKAGANPDARSKMKTTPLFLAAKIMPNLLKKKGIKENEINKLITAMIEVFMEYGANIRARNISTQNGEQNFAMGCPHGHQYDSFAETARFSEELFGEQAGKGMQAWHRIQAQTPRIDKIEAKQNALDIEVIKLKEENRQLKLQIEALMQTFNIAHSNQNSAKKIQSKEIKPDIISVKAQAFHGFFSEKSSTIAHSKQQKIQSLYALLEEKDYAKMLGEIIIDKEEISFSVSDSNHFYTADLINLLLHRFNEKGSVIKPYPAVQVENLAELEGQIQQQTQTFSFIPLNVAYDAKNPHHKNHWAALIVDTEHQVIFYLDPAQKTNIPAAVYQLKKYLEYEKDVILNPINFQQKEQEEGWIRHCGAYVIEIFTTYSEFIQVDKILSDFEESDRHITDSSCAKTVFSRIPCGIAEEIITIREKHIDQAIQLLTDHADKKVQTKTL